MKAQTSLRDDCTAEGVDCQSCVEIAAQTMAAVCIELEGKSLERLFLQLYTKRNCRKMYRSFESSYRRHSKDVLIQITAAQAPRTMVAHCA